MNRCNPSQIFNHLTKLTQKYIHLHNSVRVWVQYCDCSLWFLYLISSWSCKFDFFPCFARYSSNSVRAWIQYCDWSLWFLYLISSWSCKSDFFPCFTRYPSKWEKKSANLRQLRVINFILFGWSEEISLRGWQPLTTLQKSRRCYPVNTCDYIYTHTHTHTHTQNTTVNIF